MSERIRLRRAATKNLIIEAAWEIAREDGLAGISLRKVAARVGMRAPSLYSYFDSKSQIYDALFKVGYIEFFESARNLESAHFADAQTALSATARFFMDFCEQDPIRFQLLFQAGIPGWHPSDEAYEPAVEALGKLRALLNSHGIKDDRFVDLWTALVAGLAHQQIANDPGGNRWRLLIDDAVEMFLSSQKGKTGDGCQCNKADRQE